jgi:hypothetical protein
MHKYCMKHFLCLCGKVSVDKYLGFSRCKTDSHPLMLNAENVFTLRSLKNVESLLWPHFLKKWIIVPIKMFTICGKQLGTLSSVWYDMVL